MKKNKKNKALATGLALSILVTGTFAWQAFSQRVTNETLTEGGSRLAGGRLHDYFNGANSSSEVDKVQQVFVENYAGDDDNPNNLSGNIYARVRLSEYLEYGDGAGILESEIDAGEFDADDRADDMRIVRGDIQYDGTPDIEDYTTWDVYEWGSTAEAGESIRTYRTLEFTGSTFYMPTFNQNHENLDPEINGTLAGNSEDRHDGLSYDDYDGYASGDTELGDLKYLDDDGVEQTVSGVTHTAKETLTSTVITMADWLALSAEEKSAPSWVYDTDGWAYWSQAIEPQTATGLLLSGMNEVKTVEGTTTYYAVHAEAQLATAGDWGIEPTEEGGTGMYEDITTNALTLLNTVSGVMEAVNMKITDSEGNPITEAITQLSFEDSMTFGIDLDIANGSGAETESEVTWSVTEVSAEEAVTYTLNGGSGLTQDQLDGTITKNGAFTPLEDMVGYYFDITATSKLVSANAVSIRVFIYDPSAAIEVKVAGDVSDLKVGNTLLANATYEGTEVSVPVEWTVAEVTGTSGLDTSALNATITEDGTFAPVQAMNGGTYALTATTTTLPTLTANAEINVYAVSTGGSNDTDNGDGSIGDGTGGSDSKVTVEVKSTESSVDIGDTLTLTATVTGLSDDSVYWVIAKESGTSSLSDGEVTATLGRDTGIFEPVSGMDECTYRIKAISTVDGSFWGYKDITVNISDWMTSIGLMYSVLEEAKGTTTTISVGGVDFYVLDLLEDKETYTSTSGGTATEKECAFLLVKEPWNNTGYEFSSSSTTWASSTLKTTMETQIKTNSTLLGVAQYVDTTVASSTGSITNTYDRFFPLSRDEFNYYELSETDVAKDSASNISGYSARWLRSPNSANNVHIVSCITGTTGSTGASDSRGVRPALWAAL